MDLEQILTTAYQFEVQFELVEMELLGFLLFLVALYVGPLYLDLHCDD